MKLGPDREIVIRDAYDRLGSVRATAKETQHSFGAVSRIVNEGPPGSPGSPPGPDLSLPYVVPAWVQERPPGIHDAARIYGRTVWLSDLHYPYPDQRAVDAALSFIADWRPDLIILGGDLFDAYSISRFDKSPEQLNHNLQREFDLAKPFVRAIDLSDAEVVYILGNHEARIDALIAKNPGLSKLRALEWHTMAEIPARWKILPQFSRYRMGNLDFHHGDLKQGPGGRYVAARMLEDLKRSSLFGHFHRDQFYPEPDGDGILRASFATGHLCDPVEAAKYCRLNRWSTGFRSVDMCPATGLFEVRSHLIHSGRMRAARLTGDE